MKTILILTDFTENAAHAALSGLMLGEKLHANLLLFNVNLTQPVIPQYAGGPTVIDDFSFWEKESKELLHKLSGSLESLIVQTDPQLYKPAIHIECGEGNVGVMVNEMAKQKDIELVVMGARAGTTMDHILTGSETISVIDHAIRPVLVVPLNAGLSKLNKVVFATDYSERDINGIHYLVKLGKLFNFHLEIVHVNLFDEKDILKMEKEGMFLKQVNKLKYPHISFKEINGKDVTHRLNTLCDETGADLLSIMHYKNSFLKRIFKHSTTHRALTDQKIPLLIFPSGLEE
jgi:nucleotide-binding universal stress UspA family protein